MTTPEKCPHKYSKYPLRVVQPRLRADSLEKWADTLEEP